MRAVRQLIMWTGKHGKYYWLEARYLGIDDVLKVYPEFVERKYLVITAFDSGPLRLVGEDFKNGWLLHDELAINPYVESVSDIPCHEYDEWYVFTKTPLLEEFKIFVNNGSFSLCDPEYLITEAEPTWDLVGIRYMAEVIRELQESFWFHIEIK